MARNAIYVVKFRRRREGKTNYRKRLKLLLSKKPRLVVRKSNRYIIAHVVEFDPRGDRTIAYAHSSELRKFGWVYSCKNTPAAYLTGLLCGLRALKKGIKEVILDIGLHAPCKGAKVFAAMKGAADAGLQIPYSEEILPSEERIKGVHIAEYAKSIKNENSIIFSQYYKLGADPTNIVGVFEECKAKIMEAEGNAKAKP